MTTPARPVAARPHAEACPGLPSEVLDQMRRQWLMVMELRKAARYDTPMLSITTTSDQRTAWLRDVIQRNGLADIKVRPSRTETWAQAFERVCGEGLA